MLTILYNKGLRADSLHLESKVNHRTHQTLSVLAWCSGGQGATSQAGKEGEGFLF